MALGRALLVLDAPPPGSKTRHLPGEALGWHVSKKRTLA
jgi:hypothetical protein